MRPEPKFPSEPIVTKWTSQTVTAGSNASKTEVLTMRLSQWWKPLRLPNESCLGGLA